MVLALHSIQSAVCIKEEEREHMHAYFGDVAQLYHTTTYLLYSFNQGDILFNSEKLKIEVYRCFGKRLENLRDTNHG